MEDNQLIIGNTLAYVGGGCLESKMKYPFVEVKRKRQFKSCDPKINPADKMIKLYVDNVPFCPITVKNAKIHLPEVASTEPPSLLILNNSSLTASFPWWGILIIVFVIFFVVIE